VPSPYRPIKIGATLGFLLIVLSVGLFLFFDGGSDTTTTTGIEGMTTSTTEASTTDGSGSTTATSLAEDTSTTTTTTEPSILNPWVDRSTVGQRWGSADVQGVLMFRGNPTNTWYGSGPIPATPEIKWKFPDSPMCSSSTDLGVTSTWCGNGWTGEPVVWEHDGTTELMFGAYDDKFHFVDAETGTVTRSPIAAGDLVKGSATLDPDGYPIVYFGSRDNHLRAVALDRHDPVVIWEAINDLSVEGRWNDDWDANPRIVNGYLFEGSENSYFYIWKLNRGYDALHQVTIDPQLVFKMPTWNDDLMNKIVPCNANEPGICQATSVENSAAVFEGRVYFANSGGRVIGLDISGLDQGIEPTVVFDYWVGDDVDASIVVDDEGMLYVSSEWERYTDRARTLGQLVKLDPYTDGDPYVWGEYSLTDPPAKGGYWATPALGDGVLYTVSNKGYLVVVDKDTGEELWAYFLAAGSWSSPSVVGNHLIVAANDGYLRDFDITDPRNPKVNWTFKVGDGNLEATPAIWRGTIYLASRDGFMYAIGQKNG
jgi:outer membrane protein assembly factor BamB